MKSDPHFLMKPVNLCNVEKVFQEIIVMASLADKILRLYGINAIFAMWSPYGPGPSGLKRLFVILEGVIEPTEMIARISREGSREQAQQAEIVTTFNIITGDAPITADAETVARFISTEPEAVITFTGPRPILSAATNVAVRAVEEKANIPVNLSKIPIKDAYLSWYAALWTQSSLKYMEQSSSRRIAEHYTAVELKIGYIIGTSYNHIPSFYEFRLKRSVESICSRAAAGATWLCDLLGVDKEPHRLVKGESIAAATVVPRLSAVRLASKAQAPSSIVEVASILSAGEVILEESLSETVVRGGEEELIYDCPEVIISVSPVIQINAGGGGLIVTLDDAATIQELSTIGIGRGIYQNKKGRKKCKNKSCRKSRKRCKNKSCKKRK